jgi:histone H3/H4
MNETESEKDVLVVVSKLKNYIRSASGMNTSGSVPEVLTAIIHSLCDQAIEKAKSDGRKTVMDRDFTPPSAPAAA